MQRTDHVLPKADTFTCYQQEQQEQLWEEDSSHLTNMFLKASS